jgi:chromatin segregation and condensation protein Rec8/ScpA/Scc1 (kleisin family)
MQKLLKRLSKKHNINASLDRTSRYSLALSFLALLELIKQDMIEIIFEKDTTYVKAV